MRRKENIGLAVFVTLAFVGLAATFTWLSHVERIDKAGYHYR